MPTQLQLDGPDLESLLGRVRTELGGTARIVAADKVRTGGIGGFFARERFEVTVEFDESPPAPAPPAPAPPADPPKPPDSLLDMADQVSDRELTRVSTQSPSFADVLRRISGAAEPVTAPEPVTATEPVTAAEPVTATVPAPRPTSAPEDSPTFSAWPAARAATPELTAAAEIAGAERPAPQTVSQLEPLSASLAAERAPAPKATMPSRPDEHPSELVRLGLPVELMPTEPDGSGFLPALLRCLRRLPRAPSLPTGAGDVIALLGDAEVALSLARELARELRLPPPAVVLAATGRGAERLPARQLIADVDTARQRRTGWERRGHATVVVIDAPVRDRSDWASQMLTALQPDTTWAVVEATRKTADIGDWLDAVGGVDALAVEDLETTGDPASLLSLGVPVSRLDGRRATPVRWAALLADRIAA